MFRVVVFLGILFGLNTHAADESRIMIKEATYEPDRHAVKLKVESRRCVGGANFGKSEATCQSNGTLDVVVPASCQVNTNAIASTAPQTQTEYFPIANDSLREAMKKCKTGIVTFNTSDTEFPQPAIFGMSEIEEAYKALENSDLKGKSDLNKTSRTGEANKGGSR